MYKQTLIFNDYLAAQVIQKTNGYYITKGNARDSVALLFSTNFILNITSTSESSRS